MKKIIFLSFCLFLFLASPALAIEQVNSLEALIEVNEDSSFIVTERIAYNFGDEQRHGIYRDIKYKYKARGGNYNLRIEVLSITNGLDEPLNYVTSTEGDDFRIKIGDADSYVTGIMAYKIKYKVTRAIRV